jgi:hypothetical protein
VIIGAVLSGGIAGPALMLMGLGRVSWLSGSLLLNREAPFTMVIAVSSFASTWPPGHLSAILICVGATFIDFQPGTLLADTTGALLLAVACA